VRSEVDHFGFALTGEVVSHYRILEGLGGGGMGLVYHAEDIRLGRRVALKFLPEESAKDPEALARFEREARTASSLEHPHICPIYEFGDHQGQPFLVMPLLEGETLKELLDRARREQLKSDLNRQHGPRGLPLDQVLDLAIQIADGLHAAHEKGIVHRDIKPANIFVTAQRQAKILDFGLAKLAHLEAGGEVSDHDPHNDSAGPTSRVITPKGTSDPSLSRTGVAMGTAGYMSPEQARGEKLDARTDLFSFGLVLYEMATGRRAFEGDTGPALHDAILTRSPVSVRQLNPELPATFETVVKRALEKDSKKRYQSASAIQADLQIVKREMDSALGRFREFPWKWILAFAMGATLLIASPILFLRTRRPASLGERDMILVSDFVNTTGDSIFDGTLKQAVTVKLAESPYFNLVLESRVREALRLMERSPDERIVPPLAREVCQRTGAKVVVGGSIASLGSKYRIDLDATNCLSGMVLAHEKAEAENKERVLGSLGQAIVPVRQKLGESLSSIQKFDTPIEEATTKSLAALKAYISGDQRRSHGLDSESVPFYTMAVDLDPNFAVAYARLGAIYGNLANSALADEYLKKAFERREHVSEREKFYIASHYYADSTRESDKAIQTLELWTETYPHDWVAFNNLSAEAVKIGQLDQAVKAGQEALRLNPNNTFTYFSLSSAYFKASRFAEAKAVCEQAVKVKLDSGDIHAILLKLAVVEGDVPAIQRELEWGGAGEGSLNDQAWMAFTLGQVRKGRRLFERSRAASLQGPSSDSPTRSKDYAAFTTSTEAELEVELGNAQEARTKAQLALRLMPESVEAQANAALVFAKLGDFARAEELNKKLSKRFPSGTLLNNIILPSIRAATEIRKQNPSGAVAALHRSVVYDLSSRQDLPDGITPYYRGLAYLAQGSGQEAAAQFQKLLDNRGIIAVSPYWPLAHLGLARANALQARTSQGANADAARVRALAAYKDFLTLWKDADPDIPILKQAKAEYAKLQ